MIGFPLRSRDEEKRKLRCLVECLRRANKSQKSAREKLEFENRILKKRIKELETKTEHFKEESDKYRRQRDRYRGMIFKPNTRENDTESGKIEENHLLEDDYANGNRQKKKKRGRKNGHKGSGRKHPNRIDMHKRIYLKHCPVCRHKLKRSGKTDMHTVEDIPPLKDIRMEVTCYEIEEQWCPKCKKKVRAKPYGVIPHSRLGINLLLYAMLQKYGAKSSWSSIVYAFKTFFNIKITEGALVNMVHRARDWLGHFYEKILEEVIKSPVKYADETQWRVDGISQWLWGFFTEQGAYYTVEESRGKGVAEDHLKDSHPDDVLVRDDYGGYKKLPMKHQSCWSHLLTNAKILANDPNASNEIKRLYKKLQEMYAELADIIKKPFNENERSKYYDLYTIEIQEIIQAGYKYGDTKRIQTRITNQYTNLLTALLHKDVPLTNNLAERCIRPFVIARKMSGGSRSKEGAKTQAVNMSICQTIKMRDMPFIPTLKKYLLSGCKKYYANTTGGI